MTIRWRSAFIRCRSVTLTGLVAAVWGSAVIRPPRALMPSVSLLQAGEVSLDFASMLVRSQPLTDGLEHAGDRRFGVRFDHVATQTLRREQGLPRSRCQPFGQLHGLLHQRFWGMHTIDESDPLSSVGGDGLPRPGQLLAPAQSEDIGPRVGGL